MWGMRVFHSLRTVGREREEGGGSGSERGRGR